MYRKASQCTGVSCSVQLYAQHRQVNLSPYPYLFRLQGKNVSCFVDSLTTSSLGDMLHLAVNSSNRRSAADQILCHLLAPPADPTHQALQDQMTPQLLQELLQTAVERGHAEVVQQLCDFPAVNNLDRAAIQQLFVTALRHYSGWASTQVLQGMSMLTQYLDAQTAMDLLVLAVRHDDIPAGVYFCDLDGAQLLTSKQLEDLLWAALLGEIHVL